MTYKHFIFDLDGTLLDTLPDLLLNLNSTFRDLNLPGNFSAEEMATFLGSGKDTQIRRALNARDLDFDTHFARINALLSVYYERNTHNKTQVFPGIKEVLSELKVRGAKLYVATNKPVYATCTVIAHYFTSDTFLIVRGEEGDGIRKPDTLFFETIMNEINDPLSTVLLVGDSDVDYKSAKNLGIKCAIVPHGYDLKVREIKDKDLIFLDKVSDLTSL